MKYKPITRKEAIEAIIKMFGLKSKKDSNFSVNGDGATFMIHKKDFERYEVIKKLTDYFEGKSITNGQCRIEPITLVFTVVVIEVRKGVAQ